MAQTSAKKYPLNAKDYELYEEIGEGVSATVYRALCIPFDEIVAIKVLDLEKCSSDLVCHHLLLLYSRCATFVLLDIWSLFPVANSPGHLSEVMHIFCFLATIIF